jgi:hypothetical protein
VPLITSLKIEAAEEDGVLRPGGPVSMTLRMERDRSAAPA